ncbi:2-oxo acid dehydrogenase subunit E2 [Raineyella sp. W15-4]|uniref:2-oxo acid dehydrogenase subunit E2 n=1 Tax=Raineyella sp. W15-4 TaxID=3081651 RepID=UPI002954E71D|nr:2-oxo acid dehydrogenase subunit E2 [Raineyella sp. W15-4]WOQ16917.1 2-oxo acid dehydrogenase subunit E2 [Raineyella sp. W15-4]
MTGTRETPTAPGVATSAGAPTSRGYRVERMSRARLALAAGQESARHRHIMFALIEADLTVPRRLIRAHQETTGERLSLTAYVVTCVAAALAEFPALNAFRRGRSLVFLDEVIVEVLLERTIDGQPAVGYLPIRNADTKSLRAVHDEIRAGQASRPETIAGQRWLERIPTGLARPLMWYMRRSPRWALRLGVAGVNNLGMGTSVAGWGLAPGAGTLGVTIGGITPRPGLVADALVRQEIAHLTLAFDHDVIDGAPAARFTSRLAELLAAGEAIRDLTADPEAAGSPGA